MATYTKKLKTLNIYLMLDGETVTIADTADDDKATRALNEFKKYDTMHYVADGKQNAIPYHAVQYIEVTETDGTVTRKDPYGCEEGSDTVTITTNTGFKFKRSQDGENERLDANEQMAVAKGSTLYITADGATLVINSESVAICDMTYRPYIFTEDSTVSAEVTECE